MHHPIPFGLDSLAHFPSLQPAPTAATASTFHLSNPPYPPPPRLIPFYTLLLFCAGRIFPPTTALRRGAPGFVGRDEMEVQLAMVSNQPLSWFFVFPSFGGGGRGVLWPNSWRTGSSCATLPLTLLSRGVIQLLLFWFCSKYRRGFGRPLLSQPDKSGEHSVGPKVLTRCVMDWYFRILPYACIRYKHSRVPAECGTVSSTIASRGALVPVSISVD